MFQFYTPITTLRHHLPCPQSRPWTVHNPRGQQLCASLVYIARTRPSGEREGSFLSFFCCIHFPIFLGLCFIGINPRVLSANKVDFLFCFIHYQILLPPGLPTPRTNPNVSSTFRSTHRRVYPYSKLGFLE